MSRVLCGVDQADGKLHPNEPNLAKDLRELGTAGKWIQIPDDVTGVPRRVRLVVYHIVSSADYLGAMSMLPFSESPRAHIFCRDCDVDSSNPDCHRPFSFLRRRDGSRGIKERNWLELQQIIAKLRKGDKNAKTAKTIMHDRGLNKLFFALDPDYVPHINPITIAPVDLLHLFPDGLLRSELAWLVYIFIKMGLTIEAINKRVKSFCKSSKTFPKDVRIPLFKDKLAKGIAGGVPDSSSTVNMTGSQCMHFSLHRCVCAIAVAPMICVLTRLLLFCPCRSVEILQPILTKAMMSHPAWASWVKLVELFTISVQTKLAVSDVALIDDLQLEHSKLFDLVPEYHGLKRPKHHFLTHLPDHVYRYGPPRGFWCFGFEAFNRIIKRGARMSNWKNTTVSIMQYWSARSARAFMRMRGS